MRIACAQQQQNSDRARAHPHGCGQPVSRVPRRAPRHPGALRPALRVAGLGRHVVDPQDGGAGGHARVGAAAAEAVPTGVGGKW